MWSVAASIRDSNIQSSSVQKTCNSVLVASILVSCAITVHLGVSLNISFIDAAIPAFVILMVLEHLLQCYIERNGVHVDVGPKYSSLDTWASMTAGIVSVLWSEFFRQAFVYSSLFEFVYKRSFVFPFITHSLQQLIGEPPQTQVHHYSDDAELFVIRWMIHSPIFKWSFYSFCFIVGDFVYYWFHRWSHEKNVLWFGHNVHHSSEHYNFSTALRQSTWQSIVSPFFGLFAAVFCPPSVYVSATKWVTLYQFWVHTSVIRRLPFLIELIFSTPSHHRIHHDRRVHKNFAGVFIIWDRLFGTFQDELDFTFNTCDTITEGEICYYGVREVVSSWSEPALQLQVPLRVLSNFRSVDQLIAGPGHTNTTALRRLPRQCDDIPRIRVDERVSPQLQCYLWASFTSYLLFGMIGLLFGNLQETLVIAAMVTAALATDGIALDSRHVSPPRSVRCLLIARNIGSLILAWHSSFSTSYFISSSSSFFFLNFVTIFILSLFLI